MLKLATNTVPVACHIRLTQLRVIVIINLHVLFVIQILSLENLTPQ